MPHFTSPALPSVKVFQELYERNEKYSQVIEAFLKIQSLHWVGQRLVICLCTNVVNAPRANFAKHKIQVSRKDKVTDLPEE